MLPLHQIGLCSCIKLKGSPASYFAGEPHRLGAGVLAGEAALRLREVREPAGLMSRLNLRTCGHETKVSNVSELVKPKVKLFYLRAYLRTPRMIAAKATRMISPRIAPPTVQPFAAACRLHLLTVLGHAARIYFTFCSLLLSEDEDYPCYQERESCQHSPGDPGGTRLASRGP